MNSREHNVYTLARLGICADTIDKINRALPAIQRAHEAECNWPESVAAPFVKAGDATFRRIVGLLEGAGFGGRPMRVLRQRDPRGCTIACYRMDDDPMTAEPAVRLSGNGFTASQMERIDQLALNRF